MLDVVEDGKNHVGLQQEEVAVTDELLWCNMADTLCSCGISMYFPKTLLTIDPNVAIQIFYSCKLRRNRKVFNKILLSCSLAHVTGQ